MRSAVRTFRLTIFCLSWSKNILPRSGGPKARKSTAQDAGRLQAWVGIAEDSGPDGAPREQLLAEFEDTPYSARMIPDRFRLDGKTAPVTGCRRGIGKAMAIGLAEAGADLIGPPPKRSS